MGAKIHLDELILGILIIFLGSGCIILALKRADNCDQSRSYNGITIGIAILGFIFVTHGLFFACSGLWCPYLRFALLDRRPENVRVVPVVIAELELRNIPSFRVPPRLAIQYHPGN